MTPATPVVFRVGLRSSSVFWKEEPIKDSLPKSASAGGLGDASMQSISLLQFEVWLPDNAPASLTVRVACQWEQRCIDLVPCSKLQSPGVCRKQSWTAAERTWMQSNRSHLCRNMCFCWISVGMLSSRNLAGPVSILFSSVHQ